MNRRGAWLSPSECRLERRPHPLRGGGTQSKMGPLARVSPGERQHRLGPRLHTQKPLRSHLEELRTGVGMGSAMSLGRGSEGPSTGADLGSMAL